jgi:hypothetical protein
MQQISSFAGRVERAAATGIDNPLTATSRPLTTAAVPITGDF